MPEDQTDANWISNYGTSATGTGVFLELAGGGPEFKIRFAKNVTHQRCAELALDSSFSAFKWIPQQVASYAKVEGSRCAAEGDRCKFTCRGLGCMCHTTLRVCVSKGTGASEMDPVTTSYAPSREFA